MNSPEEPDLFPNIDDYNTENYDGESVTLENLDHLISKIVARTGLTYDQVSIIVKIYFNEIRNQILLGKTVNIGNLGKLFCDVKTTKKSKDKHSIKLKFKASKLLIKRCKYNAIFRK
jgi:nucleoid DNA-binding protein